MTNRERFLLWLLAGSAALLMTLRVRDFMTRATSLIKKYEGRSLDAYQDIAGLWTIGYGHLIKPGERYHPYGSVRTITEAEAASLLENDMATARNAVAATITRPMTDGERAAMVSLAFNIGAAAFARSTLAKLFNAGDKAGAAAQFAVWNKAGQQVVAGLVNRRASERQEFLS